jgi:hypothetical protein
MAMAGPSTAQAGMMQAVQPGALKVPGAMTPSQPSMQAPQTGLIGSEQALMGGQQQALGAMGAGNSAAQGYLQNIAGMQIQPSQMLGSQAPTVAGATMGQAPTIAGAQLNAPAELNNPYVQNFNAAGYNAGVGASQFDQGVAGLDPYAQQGQGAAKLQADLTGANGQAAQQAAIASYQGGPYAEQMKLNSEQSILRNAAVTGSVGGGNVLDQLYKNSAGYFQEGMQNQFNNLSQVSNTGLSAAGQQAGLLGQQGQMLGNLEGQQMSANAQLQAQKMGNEASIYGQQLAGKTNLAGQQYQGDLARNTNQAQIDAGLLGQKFQADSAASQQNAQIEAGLLGQRIAADESRNAQNAQLKSDAYSQLANLAQANGLNTAGLLTGTAQQLSQGRTQAGQAIAQNATQAASQIADKLAQSGLAVSDTMARDISTMTDMIYQSGMQDKIDSQQLATILANISGGQASTVAQGYSNIGSANAAGTLGVANAVQGGITQAIGSGLIG